jgi:hypothetical protein
MDDPEWDSWFFDNLNWLLVRRQMSVEGKAARGEGLNR